MIEPTGIILTSFETSVPVNVVFKYFVVFIVPVKTSAVPAAATPVTAVVVPFAATSVTTFVVVG